jgi:hypothetical protein
MERIYKFKNGTIHVMMPETSDREKLRKVTEEFLKKVIIGGIKNGDSNSSGDFRKEQVLY